MDKPVVINNGRSDVVDLQLGTDQDGPVDIGSVSRMVLYVGESTIDSDETGKTEGDPFYWTSGIPGTDEPNLFLKFGLLDPAITPGQYDAELVTYDPDNPEGIPWEYNIPVIVRAPAEGEAGA